MVRTQIQLTEKQATLIRKVAADRKMSMAAAVRQGIDLLVQQTLTIDRQQRIERALAAVGRYRSGRSDTSTKHDQAMAEAYKS